MRVLHNIQESLKRGIFFAVIAVVCHSCDTSDPTPAGLEDKRYPITEFTAQSESPTVTNVRGFYDDDVKEEFAANDKIYLYGFAKRDAGDPGVRFMPFADNKAGIPYAYYSGNPGDEWHRFHRDESDPYQEIGYWRGGMYHDFAAYYYEGDAPVVDGDLTLAMTTEGLPKQDVLWGRVDDIHFSGDTHIIPRIKLQHQLSRIRVEVMHDNDAITMDNFKVASVEFMLDHDKGAVDFETGTWSIPASPPQQPIKIIKNYGSGLEMGGFPRLVPSEIDDIWVLPGCTLSGFKLALYNGAQLQLPKEVVFRDEMNNTGSPLEIVTQSGYITVLRILFGDIKQIIFTVSLEEWRTTEKDVVITD